MERSLPFKISVASAYLLLNTSLNMLNKWALGQYRFRFPLILTATHSACIGSIPRLSTSRIPLRLHHVLTN